MAKRRRQAHTPQRRRGALRLCPTPWQQRHQQPRCRVLGPRALLRRPPLQLRAAAATRRPALFRPRHKRRGKRGRGQRRGMCLPQAPRVEHPLAPCMLGLGCRCLSRGARQQITSQPRQTTTTQIPSREMSWRICVVKICKTKAPTTTAGEKGGPGRESRILVAVARTRRPSSYTHRVSMLKWGSVIPGSGQRYSGGLRDGGGHRGARGAAATWPIARGGAG